MSKKSLAEEQTENEFSLTRFPGEVVGLLKRYGSIALQLTGTTNYTQKQFDKLSPSQKQLLHHAGKMIRDMRQVAGLSYDEMSEALELSDKSLLEAMEEGTATVSFEIILKLSSLLARHDPIPFVLDLIQAYQPELWETLESWGLGRWPGHYGRERSFTNIFRKNDGARDLSDEEFAKTVKLTQSAFNMSVDWFQQQKVKNAEQEVK
ncbi:MAG: helix-turn-helix domain-containing protein [Pseudomonadales bacterium]|nr:helix-turn-helix domain-containing protein [Pseudomonadales bacterium]